ncbi:DUF998 domain-containing protein [Parvularcula sp. ZS-1/3]|uniref:DUF998 domain-containing protein n=1 Tax=Parvularcula mediterranea TaxID=2732508 RepID=A0A7Y3RPV1_9PROT|nr:DUF998 domain-containing protein [Parvularcula mediterranea]NNU17625.1 DUF998 domain-containing protein [Parvularcula mediterranea]
MSDQSIDKGLRDSFGWTPYVVLGGAALFGCAATILCDMVMWFLVEDYNPVADTISELGAGPYAELQDTGITLFALGIVALGIGLVLRGQPGKLPTAVRAAFFALAADVAAIALYNEYGDGDVGGLVLHRWFVAAAYGLVGFLFLAGPTAAEQMEGKLKRISRILGVLWILTAPIFYLLPTAWDGGFERILAMFIVLPVAFAGRQLMRTPKGLE